MGRINNWKKIGKYIWKNISKKLTFDQSMYAKIKIESVHAPLNWFSGKFVKMYKVSIRDRDRNIENKAEYFKTKTQAIKYAINWMKKHPKGGL